MRSGGYNTKKKQMILDYLQQNNENAVTADDIFNFLKQNDIEISISTVYRFLDRLVLENKLMVFTSNDSKKSSYKMVDEKKNCCQHLHLKCLECGKVVHLDCDFMDEFAKHINKDHNFNLKCENSVLYGKCKDCSLKK
ncbi:MAG: transcriptional repressor [Oscillospiraceae bacterium]